MNTRFTALALALTTLATLATLASGCDSQTPSSSEELSFRGDVLDPPTPTTGGTLVVKGGHDNPWEILTSGYDKAPYEVQLAFEAECEKQAVDFLEQEFLANERVVEQCSSSCVGQELHWDGGVSLGKLRLELGAVSTVIGEHDTAYWQTEVHAEAAASCACV